MINLIFWTQLATAGALILLVLLQQHGGGLSELFGQTGNIYRKKRGIDKLLFQSTIIVSLLFFGSSLAQTLL